MCVKSGLAIEVVVLTKITLPVLRTYQNSLGHVRPPFVPGLEFAGIIISASTSCPVSKDSRVFGTYASAHSEYLNIPLPLANTLYPTPRSWTFTQAASLGATLPVSYGALKLRGAIESGETVPIHSAAGGLGLAAVQITSALGCRVIGTAGTSRKCCIAESFGAETCITYSNNLKWRDDVKQLTRGEGVDLVFDSVGLVRNSLRCLAHRGRALVIGFAGKEGNMEAVNMNRVLLGQAAVIGYVNLSSPSTMLVREPGGSCDEEKRGVVGCKRVRTVPIMSIAFRGVGSSWFF